MNNAYYNNMYNWSYIQQQAQLNYYHQNQAVQITECVRKLQDFLDSADKIAPEYQPTAMAAFCAVFFDHANHDNQMV